MTIAYDYEELLSRRYHIVDIAVGDERSQCKKRTIDSQASDSASNGHAVFSGLRYVGHRARDGTIIK